MIENDRISNIQLSIYIILTILGVGLFSLPRVVTEISEQDGWIAVLIGGAFCVVNFYVISKLYKKFPDYTVVEIAIKVLGKYIAIPFLLIFFLYLLFISSMTLRVFGEVIKMTLLLRTPIEVIMISILLLVLLLSRGGIEPIVRFDEIVFPIVIATILLVFIFAIPRTDFTNILPVLKTDPLKLLEGAYNSTYSFSGYEMVLLIFPFIKKQEKIFKSGMISLLIIALVYVFIVVLSLGKFGADNVKKLIWPTLTMIRSIEVPGSFIERMEGIVMTQWVLFAYTTIVPILYSLSIMLSRFLKQNEFKHICSIMVPFIYIFSLMPNNIVESYKYLDMITNYFGMPSIFVLPILLLIASSVRKTGENTNE